MESNVEINNNERLIEDTVNMEQIQLPSVKTNEVVIAHTESDQTKSLISNELLEIKSANLESIDDLESKTATEINPKEQPADQESKENSTEDRKIAEFANTALEIEITDPLSKTSYFPDHIFSTLPGILKESSDKFDNKRERDVYLLSAVSILSGCFDSVTGEYGQRTVYPNLYSFVVAPAASGKGVMVFAKQLGSKIHNKLVDQSKELRTKYELELKAYKGLEKKSEKDKIDLSTLVPPVEPQSKVLFIPADISSTRLIDHLYANGGNGIFCETEADTMAASFKQDWGGFSDKLRKAFQHEPIAYSRKGSSQFREVESPRLSLVISGTPSQVSGIIRSVADGLFSRVGFYTFSGSIEWKSAFPKGSANLTNYFDGLADQVCSYSELVSQSQVKFRLTEAQMNMLDSVCSSWLKESYILVGDEAKASAIRLGLILYRIAMTLSILKMVESGLCVPDLVCDDTIFNTAIAMSEVLKQHVYVILRQMPKIANKKETKHKAFLEALPDKAFRRIRAVEIGNDMGLSPRTVDNYLKDLLDSKLLEYPNTKPGIFQKVKEPVIPEM